MASGYQTGLYPAAPQPQQQYVAVVDSNNTGTWTNELIACDKPFNTCIYALLCPYCALASARNEYDSSNWCFNCLVLNPCVARSIIREGYGIEGECLSDIFVPWLCHWCVVAQLLQEVRNRGRVQRQFGNITTGGNWSNGICDCFSDCGAFAYAYFCPHCATATARNDFDSSNWCFNCLCLSPVLAKNIIREGYGIEGDCVGDICSMMCLTPCAIAQMLKEVRARGKVTQKVVPVGNKMV